MSTGLNNNFLHSSIMEFKSLKSLGDKTFSQIKDEDFFKSPDTESNSIAVIVRHLSGNMISRWTDFLTTDGEKPNRNRDEEFEKLFYTDKDDIVSRWENGWKCLFEALDSLNESDLLKTVYIRNQKHTVTEAINRQLAHYAYHVGQIVYLGKHFLSANWKSLSIPKGKSDDYNKKLMGK
ncbi:MAG: hypothetical protein HGGPFJEG_00898 [Ignavibacteria bacterium]|nr:hypothetical protein [Ignavibacteria bacterium]